MCGSLYITDSLFVNEATAKFTGAGSYPAAFERDGELGSFLFLRGESGSDISNDFSNSIRARQWHFRLKASERARSIAFELLFTALPTRFYLR